MQKENRANVPARVSDSHQADVRKLAAGELQEFEAFIDQLLNEIEAIAGLLSRYDPRAFASESDNYNWLTRSPAMMFCRDGWELVEISVGRLGHLIGQSGRWVSLLQLAVRKSRGVSTPFHSASNCDALIELSARILAIARSLISPEGELQDLEARLLTVNQELRELGDSATGQLRAGCKLEISSVAKRIWSPDGDAENETLPEDQMCILQALEETGPLKRAELAEKALGLKDDNSSFRKICAELVKRRLIEGGRGRGSRGYRINDNGRKALQKPRKE